MGKNIFETLVGAVVLVVAAGFVFIAYKSGNVATSNGYTITAKFDRIDGLSIGSDVRISGLKVGSVVGQDIDQQSYEAVVKVSIIDKYKLPEDSSAEIVSDGLLGSKYMALVPGGSDNMLKNGDEIKITQSAISIESLIGKYIFGGADEKNKEAKDHEPPKNEDDIF